MSKSSSPAIVIDNGSWTIKAGLAGDDEPRAVIPTLTGTRKGTEGDKLVVGQEVKDNYDDMCAHWTFGGNTCSNWDDMTALWQHAYTTLKVDPASANVLTTVSVSTPNKDREKVIEIFFEKFRVSGCYVAYDSVLSLYPSGRTSGMVVDCGHTNTKIVPVYEGFLIHENVAKMPIGGNALSEYLGSLMSKKGIDLSTPYLKIFEVAKIKEQLCRTAVNFDEERKAATPQKYTLPDGSTIQLDTEILQCTEAYFQPTLHDQNADVRGLPKWINDTVMTCEQDVRSDLIKNIILSGGSSVFPNFSERLKKEMDQLNQRSRVIANDNRHLFSFIGGSILTALDAMDTQWVTKTEFEENGASIVNTKCR